MILVSKAEEIDTTQWDEMVKTSPTASFFSTRSCYEFYTSLSFLEPFIFAVLENEKLQGVICGYTIADGGKMKRFFSHRAIVPGGALLDENISENALNTLLKFVSKSLKNKVIYIELRNYNDYSTVKDIFENNYFNYYRHLNFHVNTQSIELAQQNLNSTKRRNIRLSQKNGAKIVEITEKNDLQNYYNLLNELYLTKIKTPLFPLEFFEKIIQIPEGKIFGIKYNNEIIGGSVCVLLANKTVYEWFVCGLDGKFKNIFPSTLATWAGIEYAANNHFSTFDMMGAGKPDESYGVREFKSKFGGELVEHGRFLYICKPIFYGLGKWAVKMLKKRK